ncbi:hypothetical protein F441_12241 [Phytophthora nicotianae CJ01A1]|uniref:Uncharacterized protein n=2 Tax=Phytophthora nicotianae TaxID=4792 RepID=W2WS50_PHYNI|nr:hypothetical protein L915_11983 [Phytophthora nicotianae]ETP12369.1 hypothetical protein F441_12241 [Phytophthora nicotianae CJ01A1]
MEAVWEKFSPNIKKQAVKTDGIWSVEDPQFSEWAKLLQFKVKKKKRVVDSTKPAQAWNQWIVANKGTTVTLMVYEYGMAIATAKDRDDFMKACVLPETDRAGATAESSLREVVEALRQKWRNTFQASSIVWRMWANHETRNLNRSTWNASIANPPPSYITETFSIQQSHALRSI